jgi:hypothetical protein
VGLTSLSSLHNNRIPILTGDEVRGLLHSAWIEACWRSPFETVAVCLLPEHIHSIWSLPEGDAEGWGEGVERKIGTMNCGERSGKMVRQAHPDFGKQFAFTS